VLAGAPADLPVYVAGRDVFNAVAGFDVHRGILAVGRRIALPSPADLVAALPPRAMVVVLIGLSNHDNMGGIFRNAAALGADAILMDRSCCDPIYRKAIRVSVGAVLTVPYAQPADPGTLVAALHSGRFLQFALSPLGSLDIRQAAPAERTALYLGSEGEGLPPDLLAMLTTVRIPMAKGFDSLNVAAATAIALHRLGHRASVRSGHLP
jgi:tRNA G18 (ribose-2'-O)-methylase SpoU